MLKCHHGSSGKESTSCVLCEPIDWTGTTTRITPNLVTGIVKTPF